MPDSAPQPELPTPELPSPEVPALELSETLIPELGHQADETLESNRPYNGHPTDGADWPLISFSHVSMSFGDRKVLDNVSFTVNRGETLCILGRSGVGKSVALRILMGFLKPQVGSIRVGGEEINGFSEDDMRAIRKKVTMVFQNGALFDSMSVRENVAFPLREHGGLMEDQIVEIVDRLIGMVGAEDVADAFPASLSTGRKRAASATSSSGSKSSSASPPSSSPTTCASPSAWLTRCCSSTRAAPATLAPSPAFLSPPTPISSFFSLLTSTYYRRNKPWST